MKICVTTGSRAEYGLLFWPMRLIQDAFDLQTIVTGSHVNPNFGMTVDEFERDGFPVSRTVAMPITDNSNKNISVAMGRGLIAYAEALDELKPDVLMILGDRYEMLVAATAALIARIPIAHICGGDTTEGAFDESIRHAITKMSHMHFVTNETSRIRVIQMGENPNHVYCVGSPGIDFIKRMYYLPRSDMFSKLGLPPAEHNIVVTYHPVTLGLDPLSEINELLRALDGLANTNIVITGSNSDTHGRQLNDILRAHADCREGVVFFMSLGQRHYLNTLKHFDMIVGNSSSGLYEAPSFGIPTINIGDRQKGRLQAASVVNCDMNTDSIVSAINVGFEMDCSEVVNPYGSGNASEQIVQILRQNDFAECFLQKHFFMI